MQKQEQPGVRTLDEAEGYEERNRWNEEAEPKDSEDSDDTVDGDDSDDSDKKLSLIHISEPTRRS